MGLDMYLESAERKEGISVSEIHYDEFEEVGYWRKANSIHRWFVDNVQGGVDECLRYEVTREQVEKLYHLCVEVLENRESASQLLPSKSGFFFGNTDYDEGYFRDIELTVRILKKILDKFDFEKNILAYVASW